MNMYLPSRFFFQSWWLRVAGFEQMIKGKLISCIQERGPHRCSIDLWQCIARCLRQHLRGWGANLGKQKREARDNLLAQSKELDTLADSSGLDEEGWALRYFLEDQIVQLDGAEEDYWRQRSRLQWTLKGDSCTAFFHAYANGRRRKCLIPRLVTDEGEISEQAELMGHVYQFYQGLMGAEGEERAFSLAQGLWPPNKRISDEENRSLELTFTPAELDEVLAGMKPDSAPGPDGLPVLFFKKFWDLLKGPILQILNDFALGRVDIARLNFGVISLIPKVQGADTIKQFRPIALINVIFKFIAKAYATRLAPLAHRTIDRSQSAFIKGRCLHEGVLALHEIAHELRVKKLKGLLLKLDFEKAFDRVSWDFLREVLLRKGFSPMIVHRLMQLVSGGQTAINVNGVIGDNFRNARGVRQGDPLSPILFDFMVDSLAAIIARATDSGHLKGVVPHLIPGGITHLQYADDTLIMIEPSDLGLANLKLLLLCFENMSGLKINFAKSEAVVTGVPDLERQRVADALNCKLGSLPLHYLGLPVSDRPLSVADWNFLTEKVGHRVEPWQGLFLASAGRLELTNSCLSSLPMFAMGLYLLHDTTHAAMDRHRSRFFWEGVGPKRKYHMVDWASVCKPREVGGLGIINTKFMNIALMLKWIWKIYQNEEGLWAVLLRAKYLGDHDLFSPAVPTKGSQFWNAIQKIKWYFKMGAKHQVNNGRRTYFWLDWWTGTGPLRFTFPRLFACCDNHFATVQGVRSSGGWSIRFRRSFGLAERVEWDNLCRIFDLSPVSEGDDVVRWALEQSGEYSTGSMYSKLSRGGTVTHFKEIWRTRVPPKIRVFLWQLIRGRLPSGDQLVKRHGPSNGRCPLCGEWETCDHIFFTCHIAKFMWAGIRDLLSCSWNPAGAADFIAIANGLSGRLRRIAWFTFAAQCWTLWNIRNKLAIESSLISSPADAIFKMSIYMQSWRVLVRPRDRALLDVALDEVRRLHARTRAGGQ
jgi:hypothetical protein